MQCRHCQTPLQHQFLDLGFAPPSNAYLDPAALSAPETWYPLRVLVCDNCWLVQTEDYAGADALFDESYAYFSSVSSSWLEHAAGYADMIVDRLGLNGDSLVVELASNDGYLLKNFLSKQIPGIGIEPTRSTAEAARALGIDVREQFFGEAFADELVRSDGRADLIIGNNVFAHVPDINDFTRGMARLLKDDGTITLEFPHLLELIDGVQFDTVYHEHFSYLSLTAVGRVFAEAGLRIWDVELLPTHGGSLRIYGCHAEAGRTATPMVEQTLAREADAGLTRLDTYRGFQGRVESIKHALLAFLLELRQQGKTVIGYGAAAKGNTLLNYAGVKADLLPCVLDAAPSKQDRFLPGSHIPVQAPERIAELAPDAVLILPWNLAPEVRSQLAGKVPQHCEFFVAVPKIAKIP